MAFSKAGISARTPRCCLSTSSSKSERVSPLIPSELAIVFIVPPRKMAIGGSGWSP
jgi:hypothetical protein